MSDPMNDLVPRHPEAGVVQDGWVTMHNGQQVRCGSYYGPEVGNFFDIMLLNKGVHEPQEEYAFMQVLKAIQGKSPSMLELGSYWAFYSMWFLQQHPNGIATLVEPDPTFMSFGQENFGRNQLKGTFINSYVTPSTFRVDPFIDANGPLSILHSDIQGHELDMLKGATNSLKNKLIDYVFVATHGDELHAQCLSFLLDHQYHIVAEVDAHRSFCFDGIIVASSPTVPFTPIPFSDRRTTQLIPESVMEERLRSLTSNNVD